jgi:hypothetical protein
MVSEGLSQYIFNLAPQPSQGQHHGFKAMHPNDNQPAHRFFFPKAEQSRQLCPLRIIHKKSPRQGLRLSWSDLGNELPKHASMD